MGEAKIHSKVKALDLERIAWKVSVDNPNMSPTEVIEAVKEYRKFLTLKIRNPRVKLVPTERIDMIWHAHILDTENYAKDCMNMFGEMLHHYPFFGEFSDDSQDQMDEMFNETSIAWAKVYDEHLETTKMYRCAGKACHAPSNCRCR